MADDDSLQRVGRVPDLDSLLVEACQFPSVRAEGRNARRGWKGEDFPSGVHVPELDAPVRFGFTGQSQAVGAEEYLLAGKRRAQRSRRQIPQLDTTLFRDGEVFVAGG